MADKQKKRNQESNTRIVNIEKQGARPAAVAPCASDGSLYVDRWFNRTLEKGVNGLREEFMEMKRYCPPDMNVTAFQIHWEAGRNRYKDVPCQEKARVIVKWPGVSHDYIHANYMPTPVSDKRYICTQGPLDNTIADFWRMTILEQSESIIMLCNVKEKGMDKCAQYWPLKEGESATFEGIVVTNLGVTPLGGSDKTVMRTILKLTYTLEGKKSQREVRHYQWMDWPDRGVPTVGHTIFDLLSSVRGTKKPIIVHCSAGIGRTGSIVAISFIMERFQNGQPCEDMPVIFKELRDHRPYSIQNDVQYLFVHRVVLFYFVERYKKYDRNDPRYVKFLDEYNKAVA
ncbi:unnamed protein product [Bursaphelenchus xylophilus]|uniref:(pine wood nematode) hypothetical protein n=1 Tax=Bursaphelenchus xylophilus TaxID=6326 RepID=A0A1I7RTA3_BURXY|nr:unnamed protein product [Bursaphelenchus xylophilus]CAG9122523.1 unnamed protein product [Bursaphelenchus xylophilus]